jgi:hypothetical protein
MGGSLTPSQKIVTALIVLSSLGVVLGICPLGGDGTVCVNDLCLNAADCAVLAVSMLTVSPYCGNPASGIACEVMGSECHVVSAANYLDIKNPACTSFVGPLSLPYLTLANNGLGITGCNSVTVVNFPALQQVNNKVGAKSGGIDIKNNAVLMVTQNLMVILLSDIQIRS